MQIRITLTISTALLGFLILTWFFLSSPWLTWQLLPEAPLKIIADTRDPMAERAASMLATLTPTASVYTGSALDRVIYVLRRLMTIDQSSNSQEPKQPIFTKAAWLQISLSMQKIILGRVPLDPILIAEAQPGILLNSEQKLTLLGLTNQNRLRIRVAADFDSNTQSQNMIFLPPSSSGLLRVTLPGQLFSILPKNLHDFWNSLLQQELNLTAIKPDIVSHLSKYNAVHLTFSVDGIILGTRDNPDDFSNTIANWFEDNDRYLRPLSRSFKLSDGTFGRELIPGEPRPAFIYVDGSCQTAGVAPADYWLCRNGEQAVLASSEEIARNTTIPSDDNWMISVSPTQLQNTDSGKYCPSTQAGGISAWCDFSSIVLKGSNDKTIGEIILKK